MVVSGVGGHGGTGGMLWGHSGVGGAAGGPATLTLNGVDAANGGRPTVTVSVNDGPQVQALMDSGSTAALFPESMVNPASLGTPGQQSQYAFGPPEDRTIDFYTTYTAVLNFGDGVLTKPMTIGVITAETHNGMPVTPNEAILGVGANTENLPNFATSPVQQLPGALSQGVLFNEQAAHPYVEFGPNPVAPFASVSGAPVTDDLTISVNNGAFQDLTGAFVDTGGNGGNIPSDIVNGYQPGQYLPAGTQIQVDIPNGQGGAEQLYSETVGANSMQVTVSQTAPPPNGPGAFNTGNYVFKQMPIYFSYSPAGGTIEFDPAI
ncbi:PE-PGRS family protein [Mycobacterium bohemicum DSM 44277]|uniref:PE-PGRS family protein n=1 Tax=Mycobacterium bohemicum DSM 44277 TaxID=1236609 RepID=A0A0U0WEN3_MYCBE|nr:PE-PGRS family protein [Mycobacterium bohemicum DSM 44277]